MKRYRPDTTLTGEEAITEDNFGEYVKYSEVAIKIGESITSVEKANQAVLEASETIQKLVVENAALKQTEIEFDKMCAEEYGPDWVSEMTETPATDAAIAEINRPIFEAIANLAGSMLNDAINVKGKEATAFTICADRTAKLSANLRAGRKG